MVEAIRSLLNQSDKAIFDVKNKLKEEKGKNLAKVQEQLPTQEEITSQVKSNVCSTETAGAIDKNFNNGFSNRSAASRTTNYRTFEKA